MAFNRDNFTRSSVGQGSNAPKVFSYRTADDNKLATGTSGYFDGVSDIVEAGDFILCTSSDGMEVVGIAAVTDGVVTTVSVALA